MPVRPSGDLGFVCRPFRPFGSVQPNGYQWIPQALLQASITVFAGMAHRDLCTPTTRCVSPPLATEP
jgi:hypothetical protein